jgi:hypothetical protein
LQHAALDARALCRSGSRAAAAEGLLGGQRLAPVARADPRGGRGAGPAPAAPAARGVPARRDPHRTGGAALPSRARGPATPADRQGAARRTRRPAHARRLEPRGRRQRAHADPSVPARDRHDLSPVAAPGAPARGAGQARPARAGDDDRARPRLRYFCRTDD